MTKMSGAQSLVRALEEQKVKAIFGIVGGSVIPIYDALRDSEIRHVMSRHEQCAAHAADGYARASGKAGVCIATSGPGATNLVTGIVNAYLDSSPIIALTGQVNTHGSSSSCVIGKDAFQEADIIGITTGITKHNFQAREATEVPRLVAMAFYIATSGRPGPVLIDLPKNVQTDVAEMDFSGVFKIRGYRPVSDPHPLQIKKAAEMLAEAERPVILAGGGVICCNASPELLMLAGLLMAPVTTTLMGKGCIPENHYLSFGNIGMHGSRVANELMLEADVILAVGTRFSDRSTGKLDCFCPDARIIHVDIDSAEIGKNIAVHVPVVADSKKALKAIYDALLTRMARKDSIWLKRVKEVQTNSENTESHLANDCLNPRTVLKELRRLLPETAIVATEVGQNQMWTALYYETRRPRTFITSGGLGTMGFGFPASLGAKVACPDRPVVDVAGDGSFIMTEQELACSVEENIPVTVIVLNNNVLGMVAQWQRMFCNRRYMGVDLGRVPDFVKLADAYGAEGVRSETLKEFSKSVKDALASEVTTVIDVPISPEENVFPMVPPGNGLNEMVMG